MGFSVTIYNDLHLIAAANSRFESQLASAGLTRSELFCQLVSLFSQEKNGGTFAACLIHRHYLLKEGERMVANGKFTRPSTETSLNIVPERWSSTGEEIEHRFTDNANPIIQPPPSVEFLSGFKAIVDNHKIDVLGVCYAHGVDELPPGFIFLESIGVEDREQVVDIVPESSINGAKTYQSAWAPASDRNGMDATSPLPNLTMSCTHSCSGCPP